MHARGLAARSAPPRPARRQGPPGLARHWAQRRDVERTRPREAHQCARGAKAPEVDRANGARVEGSPRAAHGHRAPSAQSARALAAEAQGSQRQVVWGVAPCAPGSAQASAPAARRTSSHATAARGSKSSCQLPFDTCGGSPRRSPAASGTIHAVGANSVHEARPSLARRQAGASGARAVGCVWPHGE
eukprot:scaffold231789_cov33-Tisochrysis_lutea.AAC.6